MAASSNGKVLTECSTVGNPHVLQQVLDPMGNDLIFTSMQDNKSEELSTIWL